MGQGDPFSLQLEKLNGGKRTIVFAVESFPLLFLLHVRFLNADLYRPRVSLGRR